MRRETGASRRITILIAVLLGIAVLGSVYLLLVPVKRDISIHEDGILVSLDGDGHTRNCLVRLEGEYASYAFDPQDAWFTGSLYVDDNPICEEFTLHYDGELYAMGTVEGNEMILGTDCDFIICRIEAFGSVLAFPGESAQDGDRLFSMLPPEVIDPLLRK